MNPADILAALIACFCENLALTTRGAPQNCCIVSGDPVLPDCCAGLAWVRLLSAYPSQSFPQADSKGDRCRPPVWAMVVELGVDRCAVPPCDALSPACCELETNAALDQLSDFEAFRRTLGCCLTQSTDLALDEVVMGAWSPGESQGGCQRSTQTATIRWIDICPCV